MATAGLAKEWFIPGEGIDRVIISSDIQRYLGNDATVRPGYGTGPESGVRGYWVKAYRNLTTAMVDDLKTSTKKWQVEQQRNPSNGHYTQSRAYQAAGGQIAPPTRFSSDMPDVRGPDPRYQAPEPGRRPLEPMHDPHDRIPPNMPYPQPPPSRFNQDAMDYEDSVRYNEPQRRDPRIDPRADPRGPYVQERDYPRQGYHQDPGYGPGRMPDVDMRDTRADYRDQRGPSYPGMNAPQDYGRPMDMYNTGPPSAPYGSGQPIHTSNRPNDPGHPGQGPQYPPQIGAPGGPPRQDRDPRFPSNPANYNQDMRGDLRESRDPRYAYPSPAQTIVDPRDHMNNPPPHNAYASGGAPPPQPGNGSPYDQYGSRPAAPSMSGGFPGQSGLNGAMPGSLPPGVMPGSVRSSQPTLGTRPGPSNDIGYDSRERKRRMQ